MSLARVRSVRRSIGASFRRYASSGHGEGSAQYSREDFTTPFWRNALIVVGLAVAAYKYAPEPSDDVYLTRWIAMYTPSVGKWLDMSAKHTAQREVDAANTRLMIGLKHPAVHRYRYPQQFEQASPFLVGVGTQADLKDLVVRTVD